MLYYVPLECYKERYTMQWSAPVTGWLERRWRAAGVPYTRINGEQGGEPRPIKTGSVLDAVGRSLYCMSQIRELLLLADAGKITNEDVIYFDDFWHPGIEALPYAFHLMRLNPKMFAFLHAQSVDEFDFTYNMRFWMRHFEKGIARVLDGIFVNSTVLKELLVFGGVVEESKVWVTGPPFCSEEVQERFTEPNGSWDYERANKIVFSSRWDKEKNPGFFLKVAEWVCKRTDNIQFVVCTSSPKIKSNDSMLLSMLYVAIQEYPDRIVLKENLSKEEYYRELLDAKIQFSSADQDFVSITLLEAATAGCYPIYPYFRSFPEALNHETEFMYERFDIEAAGRKIIDIVDTEGLWTKDAIDDRAWIYKRFDTSWERMMGVMYSRHHDWIGKYNNPYVR